MNITIAQLTEIIKSSTKTKEVLVQSRDYYARRGDSVEETISYVCPTAMIDALDELRHDLTDTSYPED